MHYTGLKVAALSAFVVQVSAKTIKIDAGEDGLTFKPDTVNAETGDVLEYHFYPGNHSVAMGDFKKGCFPVDGGFYSGFMPTSTGENVSGCHVYPGQRIH